MKIAVKNLKGEIFHVELEPTDNVPMTLRRSKLSRPKSKKPRDFQLIR